MLFGLACGQQLVERNCYQQREVGRCQTGVDRELEEVLQVSVSDTVVNPHTVMVHLHTLYTDLVAYLEHTHVAFAAVVSPRRLPCFAFTLAAIMRLGPLDVVRCLHAGGNDTRIRPGGSLMGD